MNARGVSFVVALALAACGEEPRERTDPSAGLAVGILVADGVDDIALAQVLGVFTSVAPSNESPPRAHLISARGEPVITRAGVTLGPTIAFESAPAADVLVVAAVPEELAFRSERRNTFDHRVRAKARWTIALGAKAFEFAGFDGTSIPDATAFVVADHVVASAGGSSSDDAALFVVEHVFGERAAIDAAARCGRSWRLDRVLVLCVYGGGSAKPGAGKAGLWCEDSLFEMANVRHAIARFADRPVRFVGIACPPIFHDEKFGYAAGSFAADHPQHAASVARFVESTRAARDTGVLPFPELWFDPTLRLMQAVKTDAPRPLALDGTGALRAPDEVQTYGTPTLWILDRDGKVLAPPFCRNNWEKDRELRFTARELEDAIEAALARSGP